MYPNTGVILVNVYLRSKLSSKHWCDNSSQKGIKMMFTRMHHGLHHEVLRPVLHGFNAWALFALRRLQRGKYTHMCKAITVPKLQVLQ